MAITAKMVSDLREKTGAGMMQCKKALEATSGDLEAALDHLRKAGLKSAAKKSERETAEGRVFATLDGNAQRGHLVGVACETDFLAGSDKFISFVTDLEKNVAATDPDGVDTGERALMQQPWDGGTVADALTTQVSQFGENIQVTELVRMENVEGRIGAYVHHDYKQGAIVSVTTGAEADKAAATLKALCQHIVVFMPPYAGREDVPAEVVEREKAVIAESDEVKKKPEAVRDKIVTGKLNKFFAGSVLADQPWILDDKQSVQKALEAELGAGTRIESFQRVRLGG